MKKRSLVPAIGLMLLGSLSMVVAESLPIYRGRVLDINTNKPMGGVIVEAQLKNEALETGQRMVGRAKTDSEGKFIVHLQVNRSDIILVVSPKGSVSKLINFGGQLSMMTDVEHPLANYMHPSTKKENIILAGIRKK